jgi:hypothetical protein
LRERETNYNEVLIYCVYYYYSIYFYISFINFFFVGLQVLKVSEKLLKASENTKNKYEEVQMQHETNEVFLYYFN